MKKYVKTFIVPLAAFGVLTTGKLSTTASAHELFFDFGGGKIVASCFDFFNKNFANLVQTINILQTESAIIESLPNIKVSCKIIENTEWVLVVENASIDTDQFSIFLKNLTFPLKVIFKNIKGELGSPSEGFATCGTIEFSNCRELSLTQSFLSEMQGIWEINGVMINGIELKETLRNTLNSESGSVFLNNNSKFWESKANNDERAFHTEEPKEEENFIEKNIPKVLKYIRKNGGLKEVGKQIKKDIKGVVKDILEGESWEEALARRLKIKELGTKK